MRRNLELLLLIVVLAACARATSPTPDAVATEVAVQRSAASTLTAEAEAPAIAAETRVLSRSSLRHLAEVSGDAGILTFSEITPELEALRPGEIIVGDVSNAAPEGFLRRIVSTTHQGNGLRLETEFASLEEVIVDGQLRFSTPLDPDDVISYSVAADGVTLVGWSPPGARRRPSGHAMPLAQQRPFEIQLSNVRILDVAEINGMITFEPTLDLDIDWRFGKLRTASVTLTANEEARLSIRQTRFSAGVGEVFEITRLHLGATTLFVGPVPVVVSYDLVVHVGLLGDVQVGVEHSIVQTASLTGGLTYEDGHISPYSDFDNDFRYSAPSVFLESAVKAYAGPELFVKLYGVAGPYVNVHGYLKVEVHAGIESYVQVLGGLEANAGLKFELNILSNKVMLAAERTLIDSFSVLARYDHERGPTSTAVREITPTWTSWPAYTPTPTRTGTNTPSPTPTWTSWPAYTPTPTLTSWPAYTPTPTRTRTNTPSPTNTPTPAETPPRVLLYDDFEDPDLDEDVWTFRTNGNGWWEISGGLLLVNSGTPSGSGGHAESLQVFTPSENPLTLEVRARVSEADGGNLLFWGDQHDGVVGFGITQDGVLRASVRPNNATDPLYTDVPGVEGTAWHVYRVELSDTLARFYVDDELVATHTQGIPHDKAMHVWLDRVAWGEVQTLFVDYVRLTVE